MNTYHSLSIPCLVLVLVLSLFLIYLVYYFYQSYKFYKIFSYYIDSNGILGEMGWKKKPGPLLFLLPSIHKVYVMRILELEFFYDFVSEDLGLDLSSVRRDYFAYTKGGRLPEVVDLET